MQVASGEPTTLVLVPATYSADQQGPFEVWPSRAISPLSGGSSRDIRVDLRYSGRNLADLAWLPKLEV